MIPEITVLNLYPFSSEFLKWEKKGNWEVTANKVR